MNTPRRASISSKGKDEAKSFCFFSSCIIIKLFQISKFAPSYLQKIKLRPNENRFSKKGSIEQHDFTTIHKVKTKIIIERNQKPYAAIVPQ